MHFMTNIWHISGLVLKEAGRKKDFYVVFIFTMLLMFILSSVSIFDLQGIGRYIKELVLLLIWIFSIVVGVSMAASQIPEELKNRTAMPLLAKPVSRMELLLGKFAGVNMAMAVCLLFFYGALASFLKLSGVESFVMPLAQVFLAHLLFCKLLHSLVILGSLCVGKGVNILLSLIVVFMMLIGGEYLKLMSLSQDGILQLIMQAVYYAMPHFEFFDLRTLLVHEWKALPWLFIGQLVLYASFYIACFLSLSAMIFRRKTIS